MRKKITFLLALTAAVLLALPSQAQNNQLRRSGAPKIQKLESPRAKLVSKDVIQKAQDQSVGRAFKKVGEMASVAQPVKVSEEVMRADLAMKAAAANEPIPVVKWKNLAQPRFVSTSGLIEPVKPQIKGSFEAKIAKKNANLQAEKLLASAFNAAAPVNMRKQSKAEVIDDNGIITSPAEGETKFYTRSGIAYYLSSGNVYYADQSGHVETVETTDGTVYIKNLISRRGDNTWVKGTKSGNTLTINVGQAVTYSDSYACTLSIYWGTYDDTAGWAKASTPTITFTIEGDVLTLNGSDEDNYIGIFWDDDNSFSGYGDYETVWTLDAGYEPPSTDLVELPTGATVLDWYAEGVNNDSEAVPEDVQVAFVDNDVYISGLDPNFPDSWFKGTLSGTTVTFSGFQYVGDYSSYNIWVVGADADNNLTDAFTMTYDATAQTLTLDPDQLIVYNASPDRLYYLSYITELTLYAEKPAPAQIDELPYSNDFDTSAMQKHFTIIDANEDGKTWSFNNGAARYQYSSTNAGDDWLVSPAIKLAAGKKYHFSINARAYSASWPEKFEVKAATEGTAEALAAGLEVLPATDVNTSTFVTSDNNEFTVTTSGYYYIGVHAISEADEFYLYVDDFLIEAAPISAPYTADFTVESTIEDFGILDANSDGSTWSWSSSNYANYKWNSSNAADDYLILPIALEAGKSYDVTVNAAANSTSWAERFEVVYGTEPTAAGMTNSIIGPTDLTSTEFADYTGSFTVAADGTYYVAIHAISDADMFYLKVKTFSIEVAAEGDAPAAVDNFAVTPFSDGSIGATISFKAPTKTLDGTDLAAGDITKIEILRDGAVIETINSPAPGTNLSYEDTGMNAGVYKYQAITYGASGIGGKSEILSVFLSGVLSVPYTEDMTVAGVLDLFQVIDANEDNTTWTYDSSYGTNYSYNYSNAADDYLISMPIALETGKSYVVAVTARAYNASYPEQFEVLIGKEATVAGLTQTVIASTDVTSTEAEEFEGEFSVAEDGNYYVAIHATSAANMWRLIVSQLSVVMGADPAAPAAIELTAEPGAQGAAEVNLSFTAPSFAVNGNPLTDAVDIKIYRDDALVETLTGVATGSAQNWTDTDVATHQTYTYYVVAANASGDGQKSNKVSVYVGPDDLADVTGAKITAETASTLTFAWDQVQGENGGYIDLENIEYNVWTLDSNTGAAVDKLGSTTGETEITVDYDVDEGEQEFAYFGVTASDGTVETSPSVTGAYTWAIVGAPYDLPIIEGFQDNSLHYVWDWEGSLLVYEDDTDDDGVSVALTSEEAGTATLISGKLNLKTSVNPTLLFDTKGLGNVAYVTVLGSAEGGEWTTIGNYPVTDEFQTVSASLVDFKEGRYSRFAIACTIQNPSEYDYFYGWTVNDALIMDNIQVRDILDYDLSMAVDAPASVVAGKKATITATVTNQGQNAIGGFTVTIKAGDEVLLDQTVDLELPSFDTDEFTADFDTDVFTEAGDVTITAEVTYENDGNEANNIATTTITVKEPTAAQPTDVTATQTDEGVVVTWTAPDPGAVTTEATQDFEDSDMGEFTTIDADGDGYDWVLGSASAGVYHNSGVDVTGNGHNASNDFILSGSYCNPTGMALTPDNWLVTPPAVLNGTFSFWACAQDASYAAEHFGVFVSTAGNADPADFTLVQEWTMTAAPAYEGPSTPTRAQGNWYEYSVDLSSYAGQAGYVAIRHFDCTDMFLLNVDDISYTKGGGAAPTGYNVYIDGELVATVTDGTETTVTGVEDGDHTVAVTAVYPDGSESKPVEVTLTTTGMGQIVINTNKPVDVYSLDGKLIRKQTVSLAGLKGAYIVNGHKVVLK